MLRSFALTLFTSFCASIPVFGQDDPSPTPTPTPPGTIVNLPSSDTSQIRSWVRRFGSTEATALTIVAPSVIGDNPIGTLRQYKSDGEGGFYKESFKVDPDGTGGTAETTIDVIPVRLEPNNNPTNRYPSWNIVYDHRAGFTPIVNPGTELVLGWIAYREGKTSRDQSLVAIRFDRRKVNPTTPTNPCDGPPVDDIGEEELVTASTKFANAPGVSLPPPPSVTVVSPE
jgi:hypothetical protein